jgi:pimeloyl-ACP methyl ester carboxylesterase
VAPDVQAFQFGTSKQPLFGVYEAPAVPRTPQAGVVICQPVGHEYIRAHRALRNLSAALSAAGFHVLRFDYFGSGDSSGDGLEFTIARALADVATAIEELKDMAMLPRVTLVGVRFGATLAAMAAATRTDVEALVLWDPVMRGSRYISQIQDLERRWARGRPVPKVERGSNLPEELIGFPMTPALRSEFEAADLSRVTRWPARRLVTVASAEESSAELRAHLESIGVASAHESVAASCDWDRPGAVHQMLLGAEMVERIVSALKTASAS